MQLGIVFSLVFAIIIAVFALNNGEKVTIDFLFTTKEVSQALVILVSTAFGAVTVAIFGLVRQIKLSLKVKEQGKTIKALLKEKEELLMEAEVKSIEECKDHIKVAKADNREKIEPNQGKVSNSKLNEEKAEVKETVNDLGTIDEELERQLTEELEIGKDNE